MRAIRWGDNDHYWGGPEKGSWKGGTIGHSIEMLPDELHEAAFRRYCDQDHRAKGRSYRIRFIGPTPITETERG